MVQDIFGDGRAESCHALSEPRRHASAMKRQVRKSRSLHQNYFNTKRLAKDESHLESTIRIEFANAKLKLNER